MRFITIRPVTHLIFFSLSLTTTLTASAGEISLQPVTYRTAPRGLHRSPCTPIIFAGKRHYSKLTLLFKGKKYSSNETLYSDPRCEISVLDTTSQGNWTVSRGIVLTLNMNRMQMRPLDPRVADRLDEAKRCGKSWENGIRNEILETPCGLEKHAQYFVSRSAPKAHSLFLYDCEGQSEPNDACTRYAMAPVRPKNRLSRR